MGLVAQKVICGFKTLLTMCGSAVATTVISNAISSYSSNYVIHTVCTHLKAPIRVESTDRWPESTFETTGQPAQAPWQPVTSYPSSTVGFTAAAFVTIPEQLRSFVRP